MKVLLLAAGYGTRLYPLTKYIPKALLPIKGKPVVEYIIEKLFKAGLKDIYTVTNARFYKDMQEWSCKFDKISKINIEIINNETTSYKDKLGAVGDIKFVIDKKQINDDLFVIASDNFFDFDLKGFIKFTKKHKFPLLGTVELKNSTLLSHYGVVKTKEDNTVLTFQEKPKHPKSNLIATGMYFFPGNSLELIERYLKKENTSDNLGCLIKWISENYKVYAYPFKGHWYDIGSSKGYNDAVNFSK